MKKNKEQAPKKKNRQSRSSVILTVVFSVIGLIGLSMILYPTVADFINQSQNHAVIEDYTDKVEQIEPEEHDELMEAARQYNEDLALYYPYLSTLSKERRELYNSLLDVVGNGLMGYVEIPSCSIYLPIYHGTEESVLQAGVGHLEGSSLPIPGESVHCVLTGHSGLPSARLFTDLDQLEIGQTFSVHVLSVTLTYEVEDIRRVLPDQLNDMHVEKGRELCSLITCTPYGVNTHRLVVTGHRVTNPVTPPGDENTSVPSPVPRFRFGWIPAAGIALAAVAVALVIVFAVRLKRKHSAKSKGGATK